MHPEATSGGGPLHPGGAARSAPTASAITGCTLGGTASRASGTTGCTLGCTASRGGTLINRRCCASDSNPRRGTRTNRAGVAEMLASPNRGRRFRRAARAAADHPPTRFVPGVSARIARGYLSPASASGSGIAELPSAWPRRDAAAPDRRYRCASLTRRIPKAPRPGTGPGRDAPSGCGPARPGSGPHGACDCVPIARDAPTDALRPVHPHRRERPLSRAEPGAVRCHPMGFDH